MLMIALGDLEFSLWDRFVLLFSYHKSEEEINSEYHIIRKAMQNPNAFGPLYEKYYDAIFSFIYKRTLDEELTADLTANVFYSALYNLNKFKFKGLPFSAWLYRIALNAISMHFRKEKTKTKYITAETPQLQHLAEEMHFELSENKIEEVIARILKKLNPLELQIIEMRFFEEMSYREIGNIVSMTETNVKTKAFRILTKMRTLLNG